MSSLPQKFLSSLYTLYLFNKSDLWTIVLPITAFSMALANTHSLTKFFAVVFWIWIDLLQITVSNQSFGTSPEEDAANKPNRPIPSKRISIASARVLRWMLVPIDVVISLVMGALPAGLGISTMTAIYNEGGGHSHWFTKNGCCAIFYALFEFGGTLVADASDSLSTNQFAAVLGSAGIILTTIHAQDFRDDEGDALLGRRTFTLAFPTLARVTMPMLLIAWSTALFYLSTIALWVRAALLALAFFVGIRFFVYRTAKDDKISYNWYNIWLSTAHVVLSGLNAEGLF